MIINLAKAYWRELAIVVLTGVVIWLATRKDTIKTVTQIEFRDKIVKEVEEKIVYKDRVTVKNRVITKRGSDVRIEETTTSSNRDQLGSVRETTSRETGVKQTTSVVTQSESTRYLLGLRYFPSDRSYSTGVQFRPLPGFPAWVGPEVKIDNKNFTLGVGVTIAL